MEEKSGSQNYRGEGEEIRCREENYRSEDWIEKPERIKR